MFIPSTYRLAVFLAVFLAACGSLEHEAPFDPKSPVLKQAVGEVSGRAALENETDQSQISIVLFNGARRYLASTDKQGDYLFQNVVPGVYEVIANARYYEERKVPVIVDIGGRATAQKINLPALRSVVAGNAIAQVLTDRVLKTSGGVLLRLVRTGSIRGASNAPAFLAAAEAVTAPAVAFQTVSDGEGGWQLAGVPVGNYELTASFDEIPPVILSDVVVDGDGQVNVDPIVLQPLTGYFDIVGLQDGQPSASFTTMATVTLKLAGFNAQKMKIGHEAGNTCVYPNAAILYQALAQVVLPAEGVNTVCVRYVAVTLEETDDLKASINYDATLPVFSRAQFLSQGGYVDVNTAVLELTAGDTNSGMRSVQIDTAPAGVTAAPKQLFQTAIVVPVINPGPYTVWVRVGDLAGNYAPAISATVILDKIPPVLDAMVLNGGAARTADNNLAVAVAATDSSIVEMQISESSVFSGAAWIPFQTAASYTVSAVNGVKTVYVRARDPLLRPSNVVSASITFDTTPPADPGISFALPATYNPVVPVTLAANDNLSAWNTLEVQLTGATLSAVNGVPANVGVWLNAAAVNDVTFSGDGAHGVTARFRDQVLNVSQAASASIVVDSVAPVIQQAEFQSSQGYTNTAINILRLTASDDRTGLVFVQWADTVTALAAAPLLGFTDTLFIPLAVQGLAVRHVRAVDAAGNYSAPVSAWVTYDTTPPWLGGVTLNGGALRTNDNALTIAVSTTDVTAVELQVSESSVFSGAPWIPFLTPVSLTTGAMNGVKTVYVRARDHLAQEGNVVTASLIFDNTPPTDPYLAFASATTSNGVVPVVLSATDNISTWANLEVMFTGASLTAVNGAPANVGVWLAAGSVADVTLGGDGNHTATARFRDEVGNVSSSANASLTLDTVLPVIQQAVYQSTDGYTGSAVAILNLTASDDRTGLAYLQLADTALGLDTAPLDPWNTTLFVPLAGPGLTVTYVRAVDAAGNYGAAVTAWVIYDTTPPALGGLTVNGGAQFATNNIVAADTLVADPSVVEMQVSESSVFSGAAWIPYQTPVSYSLSVANGVKYVYARVRDPLGQVSNTIARAITLDTQAPINTSVAFDVSSTNQNDVDVTLNAEDNISAAGNIQMLITGPAFVNGSAANVGVWIAYASAITVSYPSAGIKGIAASFRDQAGNVAPNKFDLVTIDQTGPPGSITLLSAEGGNRRAELGWTAGSFLNTSYYVVQAMKGVSINGAFTPTEPDLTVTGTGTVFQDLKNNTDYTFRVRSYDAVGNPDAAYSNMLTASVGTVVRSVSWPGVTQSLIDFQISDGTLHTLVHDSQRRMAHMRSVDNGVTWTRTAFAGTPYHSNGAMVATPATILDIYQDTGGLVFQHSGDDGQTFNSYQLPTFDYSQYSYRPALAADGNLVVVLGAKVAGPGQVDFYETHAGNGGANQWLWSTPQLIAANVSVYDAGAVACAAGPRIRLVYRVTSGFYQVLKTAFSKDAGETWTISNIDATANANFDKDFQCIIDSRGSSYVLYQRTVGAVKNNRIWVDQIDFFNTSAGAANLPTILPDGSTADFGHAKMWASNLSDLYIAAQDANTSTLWQLHIFLGDGGWSTPANWDMRQIDSFPSSGDKIAMAGGGLKDFRVMYEVGATSKIRLQTPWLPAPAAFRSVLTGSDDVIATWSPLSGLSAFTVFTGNSFAPYGNSFNTSYDSVSYPNAGVYNAVATRDDYGTGEPSDIYRNFPPYPTAFGGTPFPNPLRSAMSVDPYTGDVYIAVTSDTDLWVARINTALGTFNYTVAGSLSSPIEGADIDVVGNRVLVTYCNGTDGLFVARSDNAGATYAPAVQLTSGNTIRGSTCAIGNDVNFDYATVVADADNGSYVWEVYQSGDAGDSFSPGVELGATCGTGDGNGLDADVAIDLKNPNNQIIGLYNMDLGECNEVYVTNNNWGTNAQFNGLGGAEMKVGVYDGLVYGIGSSSGFDTQFAQGSASGTDWITNDILDTGAYHVAGITYNGNQFTAAYTTDNGLQLATCSGNCSNRSGWAQGTVLPATPTDLAVVGMDMDGKISYGVFGAGAPVVKHWARQGVFTDVPMP